MPDKSALYILKRIKSEACGLLLLFIKKPKIYIIMNIIKNVLNIIQKVI